MDAGPAGLYRRDDIEARVVLIATPLRLPKSPSGAGRPSQESVPALNVLAQLSSPPVHPREHISSPSGSRKGRSNDPSSRNSTGLSKCPQPGQITEV